MKVNTCINIALATMALSLCLRPSVRAQIWERVDDKLVLAPAEDLALARTYSSFKNKGPIKSGCRYTIMTKKKAYAVGESVRVLHIMEAVEAGMRVYLMGPKPILGEFVDGKLATNQEESGSLNGLVGKSPVVDLNYEITKYSFSKPGIHTIQWKGSGNPQLSHTSNVIKLLVTEK